MNQDVISSEQAEDIRARTAVYNEWAKQYQKPNGWIIIPSEAVPPVVVTNDERSDLERYEFCSDPPEKYFLYISKDGKATTWTGGFLGTVYQGVSYRSNFGDTRVPITVCAINGKVYHGVYYKSSGDYARIKMVKQKGE